MLIYFFHFFVTVTTLIKLIWKVKLSKSALPFLATHIAYVQNLTTSSITPLAIFDSILNQIQMKNSLTLDQLSLAFSLDVVPDKKTYCILLMRAVPVAALGLRRLRRRAVAEGATYKRAWNKIPR
jgi:hypothetical protein